VTARFERTMRMGEAAALLEVSYRTVLRMVDDGRLAARMSRMGRGRVLCAEQVEELAKARAAAGSRTPQQRRAAGAAYRRALARLRDAHEQEFRGLYAAAYRLELIKIAAPPGDTGDAGHDSTPRQGE